jgi:arylsulfatase A-like enzyme
MTLGPRLSRAMAPWLTVVLVASACQATSPRATSTAARSAAPAPATGTDRPNILLIIADDFGIDTSPCYEGAEKPNMPHLQSLCDDGLVFDTVWVNPQCTPTRATILSGQYGFRTGVLAVSQELEEDTTSIQDVLADQTAYSYPNAVIGKWHLGGETPEVTHPTALGVQHYAGFLTGALEDYSNWYALDGDTGDFTTEYATTWMTDRAIDWIGGQSDTPWFLWLAYNAPHWPYHLPPADLHRHPRLSGEPADVTANPRDYYLAMAEALDTEMGRLLDSMPPGVRDNTTILFIGDNGTDAMVVGPESDPAHAKSTVYEGGVRVPLIVSGHGVTRRGEREDSLVNGTDLFATIAGLGGHPDTTINDGVSFEGALTDANFAGRTHVYTEFSGVWAVRDARYKLIQDESGERQLFDLQTDPLETQDLLASSPSPDVLSVADGLEAYQRDLRSNP